MTKVQIENSNGDFVGECNINPEKPLLRQLEKEGIEIANACKTGMCGACLCVAPHGDTNLNKSLIGEPAFPLGKGEIMTCIGGVVDTDEIITLQTMN